MEFTPPLNNHLKSKIFKTNTANTKKDKTKYIKTFKIFAISNKIIISILKIISKFKTRKIKTPMKKLKCNKWTILKKLLVIFLMIQCLLINKIS